MKGPAAALTVTATSVNAVCPTFNGTVELYAELSRTVSLKFNTLPTELKASIFAPGSPPGRGPVTKLPARIVERIGNVLVGFVVGLNDNQFGPVSLVGL